MNAKECAQVLARVREITERAKARRKPRSRYRELLPAPSIEYPPLPAMVQNLSAFHMPLWEFLSMPEREASPVGKPSKKGQKPAQQAAQPARPSWLLADTHTRA
jgi:hypothetical protein